MVVTGSDLAQSQDSSWSPGLLSAGSLQSDSSSRQVQLVLVCFHSNAILFLWHGHPGSDVGELELEVDGGPAGEDWVARC